MKYTPIPRKGKAMALSGVLFSIGAVSYIFSITKAVYVLLFQLIALVTVVAAVYVLIRYVYTSVTYIISPQNGRETESAFNMSDLDFIIKKSQGRREGITECRLSLSLLADMIFLPGGHISNNVRRDIHERYGAAKYYIYTVSFRPEDALGLVFDDNGEISFIVIEPDEVMRSFLEKAMEHTSS